MGACVAKQGDKYFWQFNDNVFSHQKEIFDAGNPRLELDNVAKHIDGVSLHDFEACRDSNSSEERLKKDEETTKMLSVAGIPTIFVDGLRIDGLPQAEELIGAIRHAAIQREQMIVAAPSN
ncbi:MAG TPA: thioredoxin domain-containing protein [Bryobacteraceae bacterium]